MKIFKIEDSNTYLLVDRYKNWHSGKYDYTVINGSYNVKMVNNGKSVSFIQPSTNKKIVASFIKNVPAKIAKLNDYNEILYKCGC